MEIIAALTQAQLDVLDSTITTELKMRLQLLLLFVTWTLFMSTNYAQESFTDCEDCPTMVVVPQGKVTIGSAANAADRKRGERPQQTASIRNAFAIAQSETTLGQYRMFVRETNHQSEPLFYQGKLIEGCNYFDGAGYGYIAQHNWKNPGYAQREDAPVVCVSRSDASQYAKWLSKKTGRHYRVPSTVEFEYALRAGSDAPWFWGVDSSKACEYANIGDQTFGRRYPERAQFACNDRYLYTAPVKKFKPNAFGLYDMVGNAWEWTNDCWHDDLKEAPLDGRSWLSENDGDCEFRVPKGGSWISGPAWSRAAVRSKDGEHYRSFMLGFRVAAKVEKSKDNK